MAGKYDIVIEQGATFSRVLTWKNAAGTPIDLTGYTAAMTARANVDDTATLFSLATGGGGITLGGAAGTITITIPATTTAGYTFTSGVYDLELTSSGGIVTRLIEGRVILSKEVTR